MITSMYGIHRVILDTTRWSCEEQAIQDLFNSETDLYLVTAPTTARGERAIYEWITRLYDLEDPDFTDSLAQESPTFNGRPVVF